MKHIIGLIISCLLCLLIICTDQYIDNSSNIEKNFLIKQLKQDPNNILYTFDLAFIYQKLKKYDKAIVLYNKSKLLEGEKGWYSEYMLGKCYEALGDWENAFKYYNSAYHRFPIRAEPLYSLASHYFNENNHSKVCLYADIGRKIHLPENNNLFIEQDIYKYKFLELLSVSAYYDAHCRKNGTKYVDKLLFDLSLPKYVKENSLRNLLFYVENIENVNYIPMQVNTPLLCDWSIERYKPHNPSIVKTVTGYIVNCRSGNCVQWYPDYVVMDGTKMPKTKNIYIEYDKDLNKGFETLIMDDPSLLKYQTRTQGLEDLRIFYFKNDIYFVATTCQLNLQGIPKMCIGKFELNKLDNIVSVNKVTLLEGPILERPEKNWMPLIVDGELLLIYSFGPYIIYKPNIETGECKEFFKKNPLFDFSRFAGSAPPIPFDDGYLVMVHEGIWLDRKYYIHRFAYLDKNLEIKKVSKPFTFKHKGVEMCCGMVVNHSEDKLIMMVALEDREAYFGLIDLSNVRSLLKNLSI